jgi:hypothetical protein
VQLLPDRLHVGRCLRVRVRDAVEEVHRLGAVLLGREQVVELQAEFLCELPHGGVTLVDQLACVLSDLALTEVPVDRPAPAAHRVVCLDTLAL